MPRKGSFGEISAIQAELDKGRTGGDRPGYIIVKTFRQIRAELDAQGKTTASLSQNGVLQIFEVGNQTPVSVDLDPNSPGTANKAARVDHHHHLDEDIAPTWTSPHRWVTPTAEITPATGALNLTATLPATDMTGAGVPRGLSLSVTSPSGTGTPTSQSHGIAAANIGLVASYTGTASNYAILSGNPSSGTGTSEYNNPAAPGVGMNTGVYSNCNGVTIGFNCGGHFQGHGGNRNYGVIGDSQQPKGSAINVGVAGFARNTSQTDAAFGVIAANLGPASAGAAISPPNWRTRYGVASALVADSGDSPGTSLIALFYRGGTGIAWQWGGDGACSVFGSTIGAASSPLRIFANAAQSADLFQVNSSGGARWFAIEADGAVDLGLIGRVESNVADGSGVAQFIFQPDTDLTTNNDRDMFVVKQSANRGANAAKTLVIGPNGELGIGVPPSPPTIGGAQWASNAILNCGSDANTSIMLGLNFNPRWGAVTSGATTVAGLNALVSITANPTDNASATVAYNVGLYAAGSTLATRAHTGLVGAIFQPWTGTAPSSGTVAHGNLYGWWVKQATGAALGSHTATNAYGGYIDSLRSSNRPTITNAYGLVLDQQTVGTTINNSIFLNVTTGTYKALAFRDQNAWISSNDASHLDLHAATSIDANADFEMAANKYIRIKSDGGGGYGGSTPPSTYGHIAAIDISSAEKPIWVDDGGNVFHMFIDYGAQHTFTDTQTFDGTSPAIITDGPIEDSGSGQVLFTTDIQLSGQTLLGATPGVDIGGSGGLVSFFGGTPTTRPTDAGQAGIVGAGGSYDGTLVSISGTGDDTNINNNFEDLRTLANELRQALVDLNLIQGS